MTDKLKELAEEFDVDLDTSEEYNNHEVEDIDIESREITVIKPYRPGNGFVRNETHNAASGDKELSVTIKHRPECPSCSHILGDADERNQLKQECRICGVQTCPECMTECEACEISLCPDHAEGHGLKDNPYCGDCLGDVNEDIEFDRSIELDEHRHKKKLEEFDKALKSRKGDAELVESIRKQRFKEAKEAYKLKLDTAKVINSSQEKSEDTTDNSDFRKSARKMRKHGFKKRDQQ